MTTNHSTRTLSLSLSVLFCAFVSMASTAGAQALLIPTDPGEQPLALSYHRVEADIEDGTAQTKIDQAFRNHTSRVLEATYVFPVPAGATVDDFALYMGGKRVEGSVLEATEARRIYEDIVRRARDPGLIEWIGKDLFRARVFPIPARGEQRVELRFSQVLPMEAGLYRYTYPLRGRSGHGNATEQDFTFTARIQSQAPIRSVYSPSHEVYVRQSAKNKATVGFERDRARLDRDLVLYYTVGQEELGMRMLTHRSDGEAGYFLLMVSPPSTFEAQRTPRKSVTFVLDTSGSMNGEKMDRLREATLYGLQTLGPDDHFALIRFSSDVERYRPGFLPATRDNIAAAKQFVEQMEAAGGTAIHEALEEALGTDPPSLHYVVFVTDGRPTVGETDPSIIAKTVESNRQAGTDGSAARLFAFGVGDDLNAVLLDRLAALGNGKSTYMQPGVEQADTMRAFFDKLSYPALSGVQLQIDHVDAYGILPRELGDLFYGEQIFVVGRYRKAGDALVRVGGRLDDQTLGYDYETTLPEREDQHDFIANLWAERQVGFLLDQVRQRGENPELVDEIVQLAKRFGIVTPYTSYLIVEPGMQISQRATRARGDAPGHAPARVPDREIAPNAPWGGLGGSVGRGVGGGGTGAQSGSSAMGSADSSARPSAGWGGEANRAATARPEASPAAEALAFDMDEFEQTEGKSGVRASKKVAKMKDANRSSSDSRTGSVYVDGVAFERKGTAWVDARYRSGMKTIEVQYLSEAYFSIVNSIPSLRDLLALGDTVTLVRNNVALVVSERGKEKISADELESLR